MQSVRVGRSGISADEAATVLRTALGHGFQVEPDGEGLLIRKGLARAQVNIRSEERGTIFDISSKGTSFLPLFNVVSKALTEQGLPKKTASAIDQAESFRDDS
ncbi:MAG TPA: hypothetical protein VGG75_14490 [Trebonia sp.]|jgi:predicted amidohydrolase